MIVRNCNTYKKIYAMQQPTQTGTMRTNLT